MEEKWKEMTRDYMWKLSNLIAKYHSAQESEDRAYIEQVDAMLKYSDKSAERHNAETEMDEFRKNFRTYECDDN